MAGYTGIFCANDSDDAIRESFMFHWIKTLNIRTNRKDMQWQRGGACYGFKPTLSYFTTTRVIHMVPARANQLTEETLYARILQLAYNRELCRYTAKALNRDMNENRS